MCPIASPVSGGISIGSNRGIGLGITDGHADAAECLGIMILVRVRFRKMWMDVVVVKRRATVQAAAYDGS